MRNGAIVATSLCAVVFFLGAADQWFAMRILGVNVRLANLVLAGGLITWLARRAAVGRDMHVLAIGWLPFLVVYLLAAALSPTPALGALKLAWFAFNFLTAFAWCSLFASRTLARGYFSAFLAIAAILVFDFASGFTHGPSRMIGFAQPNDLVGGAILYRPTAFYYEPSYAASGVGLALLLAMTPLGTLAPAISTLLIGVGVAALTVTMSRTGWLFAAVGAAALMVLARLGAGFASVVSLRKALVGGALFALFAGALLIIDTNRTRTIALWQALGWTQTVERVCPMLRDRLAFLALQCLSAEERARAVGRARDAVPQDTAEGQRLAWMQGALARVEASPLLGHGVARGDTRLIDARSSNVWLEIAVEGGLLSVAAFVWGLGYTLHRFGAFRAGNRAGLVVLLTYFVVAWPFLQTFPRLDQWLAFWVALTVVSRNTAPHPYPSPVSTRGDLEPRDR